MHAIMTILLCLDYHIFIFYILITDFYILRVVNGVKIKNAHAINEGIHKKIPTATLNTVT